MGYVFQPLAKGVKYSQTSDLSAVKSLPKTPFLDMAMTVD